MSPYPCPIQGVIDVESSSADTNKQVGKVKRDMELVREIFRAIIARDNTEAKLLDLPGHDEEKVGRHVEMLYAAGYIHGFAPVQGISDNYQNVFIRDLTWQGHEFAGALLTDEGVWQKVKASFGPQLLATVPLKVVEGVAMEAVTAFVKAKIGLGD